MSKPVLFCDVDGVINVPKNSHASLIETPFTRLSGLPKFFNYKTFRHRPQVAEFIKTVNADLVWLTAWQRFAPPSLDVLFQRDSAGFLPWEHGVVKWFTDRKHFSKSVALNSWVENNPDVPFIWVDDHATQFADRYNFSHRDDVLILQPESSKGLTDMDIDLIHEFTFTFSS